MLCIPLLAHLFFLSKYIGPVISLFSLYVYEGVAINFEPNFTKLHMACVPLETTAKSGV
jgi:hypothetical protein